MTLTEFFRMIQPVTLPRPIGATTGNAPSTPKTMAG